MARPPLEIGTAGKMATVTVEKGKHRARVYYRDSDGITRLVERSGVSAAAAERKLKAALKERVYSASTETLSGESSIEKLLTAWWDLKLEQQGRLSVGTKANYSDVMQRIIMPGIGGVRIREATTKRLDTWLLTEQRLRPSQADIARTILRQAFDLAARWDLCAANPARSVSRFERPVKTPRALTTEELTRWRAQLQTMRQNTWLADLVEVQLALALRVGEALALKVDALDLDNPAGPRVHIRATVITPTGAPHSFQNHTKDGPDGRRTVIAPEWAADILRRRAQILGIGLLFPTRNGTLISPGNLRDAWRRERKIADLDWLVPHDLRKTALTQIASVYGNEIASKFADHKSLGVTEKHYLEAGENIGPDVRTALDALAPGA